MTQIDNLYESYNQSALRFCDGDVEKAERFMDTNVYQYHYRLVQKMKWIEWHNDNVKKQTSKTG